VKIAIVVGNPKAQSKTLDAALHVTRLLADKEPDLVVNLAEIGPKLLEWNDPDVAETVKTVCSSDNVIFASPTFKATYAGLLKLFLDQFPYGGLKAVHAFPLMLGAAPQHALAPDLTLKPVLVELGAICPVRGLYLLDSDFKSEKLLADWVPVARRYLKRPDDEA
jgi:FMN reductase